MKRTHRSKTTARIAKPLILACLLALALLPGAALAAPPPVNGGNQPPANNDQQQNINPPPQQNAPPSTNTPPTTNTPPSTNTPPTTNTPPSTNTNPPPTTNQPPATNTEDEQQPSPHPDAPNFPSADCIVTHAATPAQLCPIAGGLQYYFIGADGSSQTGPYIKPFSELATLHTSGTSVRLYTGSNPFTGKSVTIDYLVSDDKLRISTYYPDTMYDTDKPYTFTVDSGNSVSHEAW